VPGHANYNYDLSLDSAIANDLSHHPSDKNAGIQQHIQDWLESAQSSLASSGKLAHAFQPKMHKSSARLHAIINRALLGAGAPRFSISSHDVVDLMRCSIGWDTVLRQQSRPERRADVSPASKPAEFDNTFAGLSLFQRAVERLELLDVSCTAAQGTEWKQIHSIIDTYCIPIAPNVSPPAFTSGSRNWPSCTSRRTKCWSRAVSHPQIESAWQTSRTSLVIWPLSVPRSTPPSTLASTS
jgi:hypothetical protein